MGDMPKNWMVQFSGMSPMAIQPFLVRVHDFPGAIVTALSPTLQMMPTGASTSAGSFCAAATTSAGFCGQSGSQVNCVYPSTGNGNTNCNTETGVGCNPNTGGVNGYGQGTGSNLATTSSTSFKMQVCIDHQDVSVAACLCQAYSMEMIIDLELRSTNH
jgi:hypothetical protein